MSCVNVCAESPVEATGGFQLKKYLWDDFPPAVVCPAKRDGNGQRRPHPLVSLLPTETQSHLKEVLLRWKTPRQHFIRVPNKHRWRMWDLFFETVSLYYAILTNDRSSSCKGHMTHFQTIKSLFALTYRQTSELVSKWNCRCAYTKGKKCDACSKYSPAWDPLPSYCVTSAPCGPCWHPWPLSCWWLTGSPSTIFPKLTFSLLLLPHTPSPLLLGFRENTEFYDQKKDWNDLPCLPNELHLSLINTAGYGPKKQ